MNSVNLFKDLQGNKSTKEIKNEKFFLNDIHNNELFLSVILENANSRLSNASTLTKAEVRGGGRKPYKQKHTGRARQGSIRNPHYVGGGRAFGPTPEKNYKLKQNNKAHKLAFKSAMSLKLSSNSLNLMVNDVKIEKPSTKTIETLLEKMNWTNKKVLFVLNEDNANFIKSCANINKVTSKYWNQVSVKDLLNSDVTIMHEGALNKIMEVFA